MAEKVKLTFLGTASAIPTAKRNHPAVLLDYKGEHMLIDCGEGTQRQFRKARLNPCKVNRILISHWHADHILGIPGLLQTLGLQGYKQTIFIYGPKGTKRFMKKILDTFIFKEKYTIKVKEVYGKFFETEDFYLEAKQMTHGIPCNAYSFVIKDKLRIDKKKLSKAKIPSGPLMSKLKQGKDISYNGKKYRAKNLTYIEKGKKISIVMDTGMNKKIVAFVKNSDLLICESSFDSNFKDKAKEYLHLTAEQAGQIAKKSKSKELILTHISQRYDKDPKKILNDSRKVFKNSFLVQDLDVLEI